MPKILSQPFIEYSFTDEELINASVLTELQTQYFETRLSQAVVERANLAYEPGSIDAKEVFIYQQEYLRGQIEILQWILNTSIDCKDKQMELHRQQAASQNSDFPN